MGQAGALVLHHGALGDLFLSLPALRFLKRSYPKLILCAPSPQASLFHRLCLVDGVIDQSDPQILDLFSGSKPSSLLDAFEAIYWFSRKEPLIDKKIKWIPTLPDSRISVAVHQLRQVAKNLTQEDQNILFAPIRSSKAENGKNKVFLHPGSGSPKKCWPWMGFSSLIQWLLAKVSPKDIFVVIGPSEQKDLRTKVLASSLEYGIQFLDSPDLYELFKLASSASIYIGNDSGITHLFAWAGAKTIAIFGPTDPRRWAPPVKGVKVVCPDIACSPCDEAYRKCKKPVCIGSISLDVVIEALSRIMHFKCLRKGF